MISLRSTTLNIQMILTSQNGSYSNKTNTRLNFLFIEIKSLNTIHYRDRKEKLTSLPKIGGSLRN